MVKIGDVASAAGVAVGTVSRVLNGNPTVSEPIRTRVQAAIAALGYERDPIARTLRGGPTGLVACAIRDFDIPGFALYIKEAERLFRVNGFTLLLSSTTNMPDVELGLLRDLSRRRVDGLMTTVSDETHDAVRAALTAAPMPVLLIDRERPDTLDRISVDHRGGAREAVLHLAALGHRRIAVLVGDVGAHPGRARVEGARDGFLEAGLPPGDDLVRSGILDRESAFRETTLLLGLGDPPTAVFVAAMDMLAEVLKAARACGFKVGEDLSVVAGSDSDLAELYDPPITAVRWDLAAMGRHASAMLLDRMRGGRAGPPRHLRLATSLVVRQSCRRPSPR